ncbi:hypothetical protein B0H16DRAFT_1826809 [Mycena metata]|uniref:Berberine/berberine-like domain-containing protein n=1 Tax=Mycena metata TaxID=1033252 RepID=A0AAD7J3H5_9AGAR|nr:hypothetical protein B0H16DRAFT_1826809 [Mycena metata]
MSAFGFFWNATLQDYVAPSTSSPWRFRRCPPRSLGSISAPFPVYTSMRVTRLTDLTEEVADMFSGAWGFIAGLTVQPINRGTCRAGVRNGGNPMGLRPEDADLKFPCARKKNELISLCERVLLMSLFCPTSRTQSLSQLTEWAKNAARERGLLNPFLYINYLLGTQRVLESVGNENFAMTKKIRDVYDPQRVFKNHWRGVFKL